MGTIFRAITFTLILLSFYPTNRAVAAAQDSQISQPQPSKFWSEGDKAPNEVKGAEVSRDQLISDFMRTAFSNSLWLENSGTPSAALAPFKGYVAGLKKAPSDKHSWLQDFISRRDGIPPHDRIAKWTHPVSVGIGWPS